MAITRTQKVANKSSTNATNYNTATLTAVANRLYVIGVLGYSGTLPSAVVTGGGLGTWTRVDDIPISSTVYISIHYALSASPGAGAAVNIAFGTTMSGAAWDIEEFDGVPTTGTQGADAVGSAATNFGLTGTSLIVTLGSVASDSAVYGCFGIDAAEGMTPGGSYAETTEQQLATEGTTFEGIYLNPGTTTPSSGWTSSVNNAGAAIEIKIAGAAAAAAPWAHRFARNLSGPMIS